jgi:uridine kinase
MFKVEVKINGDHLQSLTFADTIRVKDVLSKEEISEHEIILFILNGEYACPDDEISDEAKLECVSMFSSEGYATYQHTSIFILCKAFNNIFTSAKKLIVEHSIGDGVFCEMIDDQFSAEDVQNLREEMQSIITNAMPIDKLVLNPEEAKVLAEDLNRDDFIKYVKRKSIDTYRCGNYQDYFIRNLAYNTSVIKHFEIVYHSPGIILRFPYQGNRTIDKKFVLPKNLFATHQEHDKWLNILDVHMVSALNRAVKDYKELEKIQMEEALHEKKIVDIANHITWKKDIKLILIAGPSSSGKTTFAKRLGIHLRVNGLYPHILGMDDYFLPRAQTPRKEDGELDYESIKALDVDLLNDHLNKLLNGESVDLPKYNFLTGKREPSFKTLQLDENDVLVFEGIHGLNDELTSSVPFNHKMKIYVSALNNLNIDAHNRIPTTDSRKIRRLVRDNNFRGHSAEQTLAMWDSIREGEDRNIFPFQENADFMFNSTLTYELCVLKKYVKPLLKTITNYSPYYLEARRLLWLLSHVYNIEDSLVPSNSILREFIGGSIFNY